MNVTLYKEFRASKSLKGIRFPQHKESSMNSTVRPAEYDGQLILDNDNSVKMYPNMQGKFVDANH